jgi:CBS domain-containing protein
MKVGDVLRKKSARIATIRMNETVGIAAQLMRASNVSALVVKDVVQLVSCTSNDTLDDVRHLMNKHHIRHLPVIDDYNLCGVISIRDISAAVDEQVMAAARTVPA